MESSIKSRFEASNEQINHYFEKVRNTNKSAVKYFRKLTGSLFTESQLNDNLYVAANESNISMRLTFFMTQDIAQHMSKVLSMMVAPFYIKMDASYTVFTPEMELKKFHGSRNSTIPLQTVIIREKSDLEAFFDELGMSFTADFSHKNDYSLLIEKIISNHDNRFGIIKNSHFSFNHLANIELFIESDQALVKQWESG